MRFRTRALWRAAAACAAVAAGPAAALDEIDDMDDEPPVVLGYLEDAAIGLLGLEMKAKLDTGADSTSVHARDVEIYRRPKKGSWVRFRLIGKAGRAVKYDQRIVRYARIKTKTGGSIRRPVIRMPICVGGRWGRAEINLADRDVFEYDMLIGREFLADRVLVDSGNTFAAKDDCSETNAD
ncbi:MAG: RimK/LysX family protein [Pseudomonadota bacterium]